MLSLGISTDDQSLEQDCQKLAAEYSIPFYKSDAKLFPQYLLKLSHNKLFLIKTNTKKSQKIYIDFCKGKMAFRRRTLSSVNDLLARAIGVKKYNRPTVLDATAGFGQDSFLLTCLGCKLTIVEKNPILYLLLKDAWQRFAAEYPDVHATFTYELVFNDAKKLMESDKLYDVIYLDPMFPIRTKSALVKKEMQFLHDIVETSTIDDLQLFTLSLQAAKYRVVVKRPLHAETISPLVPSFCYKGKAIRYDVYTCSLA